MSPALLVIFGVMVAQLLCTTVAIVRIANETTRGIGACSSIVAWCLNVTVIAMLVDWLSTVS